jgi:hypothetical protein
MTARQPFSMVPHGDFLARCADLEGDEIALFSIAFFLMLERRGPIADDMAWLGRRASISTRRANQIRLKLLDQGKWVLRDDMLGDPGALAIVGRANARSAINASNVMKRWDKATQPELALGDEKTGTPARKPQKSAEITDTNVSTYPQAGPEIQTGGKTAEKPEINGGKTELKVPLKSGESQGNQSPTPEFRISDSHTRATPELESDSSTTDSESCEPGASPAPEPGLDDADVATILAATCTAAGFNPTAKQHKDRASAQVERWRADGISFDRTVIPTIGTIMAATHDPTSSLSRFDRQIRLAHAKITGTAPAKRGGNGAKPPPTAEFIFAGEPTAIAAVRRDLCDAIGPTAYCRLAHDVRFEQMDERPIIRINPAPGAYGQADHRLKDHCLSTLIRIARQHGFNQVW